MVPKPSPDVVSRRLGDSAVLIRLSTNRIFELNATGARVWELLESGIDVDAIVETLSREFAAASETVRTDVDGLLERLRGEGLVVEP